MRKILALGLLAISLFMLLGFFQAGAPLSIAGLIALVIGVGIPGACAALLLMPPTGLFTKSPARREQLRRQTIESEIVRLAGRLGGTLTVVEVVAELALESQVAQDALDALMTREIAEIGVSDSGLIVYRFPDLLRLDEKDDAEGL